jgi:hypothetical protein
MKELSSRSAHAVAHSARRWFDEESLDVAELQRASGMTRRIRALDLRLRGPGARQKSSSEYKRIAIPGPTGASAGRWLAEA